MIWGLLTGGIGGVVKGFFDLGKTWLEGKQKKAAAKAEIATKIIMGDVDYNVAAQQGMQSSWKDEFLTVYTCSLLTLHFIPVPEVQEALQSGWTSLSTVAPDWFGYCVVGMYVAVYGLKGWKIFTNK
jgi:hypothetical protein